MRARDSLRFAFGAVRAQRLRTGLSALGIAIGIAMVVLLTSIGAGVREFVLAEFSQFGTHLIAIAPGKTQTHGATVGMFGSVRPLTIDDAVALARVRNVEVADPLVQGNVEARAQGRSRRVTVYGVGSEFPQALRMQVGVGRFLPPDDPRAPRAFAVLGSKVRAELFGATNPLGARIQVGRDRYRVVGVMAPKGQVLGFDMDDIVYIPAARALELFNRDGLMEIHVVYDPDAALEQVVADIRRTLVARHGEEDFTITPQQQMLDTLGSVLNVLTFAVGALGGVSLLVGAVGILTIMTISVTERTGEVGLLRALGAGRGQVLALFLSEAAVLAALGGFAGLVMGAGLAQLLHLAVPALPVDTPWDFAVAAEVIAIAIGLIAGVLPARRAAGLTPVEALRAE